MAVSFTPQAQRLRLQLRAISCLRALRERRLPAARVAHREAFGVDELDVRDAEEARGSRARSAVCVSGGVPAYTPPRVAKTYAFLPVSRPTGALLGVAERHAGARDVVEVGLELRRHAEVVHRQAEHDHVGAPAARRSARRNSRRPPAARRVRSSGLARKRRKRSASRCGTGSRARSRAITFGAGVRGAQPATNSSARRLDWPVVRKEAGVDLEDVFMAPPDWVMASIND